MQLSVVITTHRRPLHLRRALRSILKDIPEGVEVLLCADDDSNETFEIARSDLRASDSFIRLPNSQGPAATRNFGAQVASGSHICFLDDDDTFAENHIKNLCEIARKQQGDVRYFNYRNIFESHEGGEFIIHNEQIEKIDTIKPEYLNIRNFIPINALLFPKSVFRSIKFDERLNSHEDWEFLLALLRSDWEFRSVHSDQPCVNVHIQQSGQSRNKKPDIVLDYLSIYRKWRARSEGERAARAKVLAGLGLSLPNEIF